MPYPDEFDVFNAPVNNFSTTLSASITDSDTTISLTTAAALPTEGIVTIDGSEIVIYTGKTGNNLTGCARGHESSSAASHALGATVERNVTGGDISSLQDAVSSLEENVGLREVANLNDGQLAAIDVGTIFFGSDRFLTIDYTLNRTLSSGTSRYEQGRLSLIRYSSSAGAISTLYEHIADSAGGSTDAAVTFSVSVSSSIMRLKYVSAGVVNTTDLIFDGRIIARG